MCDCNSEEVMMKKIFLLVGVLSIVTGCSTYGAAKPVAQIAPDNGYGSIMLADGSVYSGEIKDSKANGFGTVKSKDAIYTGAVKNGKPNGFGQTVTNDGAIYDGEHVNGEFHGRGKLTLSDGSYFIGMMRNNKVHKGTMHFTDGRTMPII